MTPETLALATLAAGVLAFLVLAPLVPIAVLGVVVAIRRPAPRVHELSQGGRTVTFVEMCHVGPQAYFDRVAAILGAEAAQGATHLYEKVGPGTPGDRARLARILGIDPNLDHHKDHARQARIAGWAVQPHEAFLALAARPPVWADMTLTDVLATVPPGAGMEATGRPLPSPMARIRRYDPVWLLLGLAQRVLRRHVLRQGIRLGMVDRRTRTPLAKLTACRDERLVEVTLDTPGRLVITYGAGHYPAFLRLLRERGPVEVLATRRVEFG